MASMRRRRRQVGSRGAKPRRRGKPRALGKTIVAIESTYEAVTAAGWEYRKKAVHPQLVDRGFKLVKLEGKLARRYLVQPEVTKTEVVYLTGVGHGLADLYTGDQGEAIFQVGRYLPQEANGKIVHFLSCQTGRDLGPDFVRNGCLAYFGYDVNFSFHWQSSDVFFECDSEIDRGFADGLTANAVYRRAYDLYSKRIRELNDSGHTYVAATLETDRDHLVAPALASQWGDGAAKL